MLAAFRPADVVAAGHELSRGAARVFQVLHRLAVDVARYRSYVMAPGQVVFHVPLLALVGAAGYARAHLYRLLAELKQAGLLDGGGHAQHVLGKSRYDGCVWAVKTCPEADPPRVRAAEWRHRWRPDFEADILGQTGAAADMRQVQNQAGGTEEFYQVAYRRAASPDAVSNPAGVSTCPIDGAAGLRAVSEQLGAVWACHPRHRARQVGQLARTLSTSLGEPDRRKAWCRVIWDAWRASVEGRAGLQGLAGQLARLAADLDERAPWRSPGAVLMARLR